MKFFIASPWRNKVIVEGLTEELTKRGYEVYSFLQSGANLSTGTSVVEELKIFSDALENWQDNVDIKRIFEAELAGLKQSDAVILLEPAGRSSLLEAGAGFGMGKKVFVVGRLEKPEVALLGAAGFYPDVITFLNDLERIAPK